MPLNLFYTMVQKSQKWPKTQIKGGGPALNSEEMSIKSRTFALTDLHNGCRCQYTRWHNHTPSRTSLRYLYTLHWHCRHACRLDTRPIHIEFHFQQNHQHMSIHSSPWSCCSMRQCDSYVLQIHTHRSLHNECHFQSCHWYIDSNTIRKNWHRWPCRGRTCSPACIH